MALLGSSVDPRLFMQDYSGFTRAAEIQAQGMQNLGAAIGQGIKDFGEARQERKKLDAGIKANRKSIESALKLGESLGIDVSSLNPILEQMDDPNVTPMEAAALGQAGAQRITDTLNLGIGLQDRAAKLEQSRAENLYKQGMLEASRTRAAASLFGAKQAAGELKETEISIFDPEIGKERKEKVLLDKQGQYYERDTKRPILNTEKFFYGEEGGLGELPPTSQVGGENVSDLIANAQDINILPVGSKIPTTNVPYDGRPAANRYNNPGGAYPRKDLVQFGMEGKGIIGGGHPIAKYPDLVSGAAANMEHFRLLNPVGKTVGQMRKKWVYGMGAKGSLPISGLDENKVITQKDLNDPTFMSKWMSGTAKAEGFKGRLQPEQLISAFNLYQAGGYNKNAQSSAASINSSLAIGGDMTQQAMGTPDQQAMAAQQIEQGASMAIAQTNQGVPTEPSMATQQPQLPQPQRRMVRGIPAGGGTKFRQFTPEEVTQYGSQGQVNVETGEVRPIRPPSGMVIEQTKDGGFRIVQGAGAAGRQEQAAQAAKEQGIERATMGTQEIGRALKVLDSGVMQGSGPLASFYRAGASKFVKGTPEYKLANDFISPIKSMLAFNELNKMRMASPTGGALGNVAKFETDMLQQSAGQLDIDKTDPQTLRENLMRLQEKYLDVIHGSSEQRRKLLQEGKITKEQYFDIESSYPAFTMSATGETVPRQMEGVAPQAQESEADRILRELGE